MKAVNMQKASMCSFGVWGGVLEEFGGELGVGVVRDRTEE